MKKIVAAALVLGATSASAAGQFSTLITYDAVFSQPSTATGTTTTVLNTAVEYVFPRSLSLYGGFAFIMRDSFESAINYGVRFYSPTPLFNWGGSTPVWSYLGLGYYLVDNNAYYPEAGLRVATSNNTRMDIFLKVFNSDNTAYDKMATIGVGLAF